MNRQASRSERVMRLVRKFVLTCLEFNMLFCARYIAGIDNDDALSRFQEERFQSLAPSACSTSEEFPEELWSLGS